MWADKESSLSLRDRTFTYISLEVQLDLGVVVGSIMYGLDTAIYATTNRTNSPCVALSTIDVECVPTRVAGLIGFVLTADDDPFG